MVFIHHSRMERHGFIIHHIDLYILEAFALSYPSRAFTQKNP